MYYEDFRRRTERIPTDAFDRGTLLYEAAHDAYQTATDRLTEAGWEQDQALVMGRLFSSVVKRWVDSGPRDISHLEQALRAQYQDWAQRRPAVS